MRVWVWGARVLGLRAVDLSPSGWICVAINEMEALAETQREKSQTFCPISLFPLYPEREISCKCSSRVKSENLEKNAKVA